MALTRITRLHRICETNSLQSAEQVISRSLLLPHVQLRPLRAAWLLAVLPSLLQCLSHMLLLFSLPLLHFIPPAALATSLYFQLFPLANSRLILASPSQFPPNEGRQCKLKWNVPFGGLIRHVALFKAVKRHKLSLHCSIDQNWGCRYPWNQPQLIIKDIL